MTPQKETWQDMATIWQEGKGFDADKIAADVRRKTRQMKLVFGLELLFGAIGAAAGAWLIVIQDSLFELGIGLFALLFSVGLTWLTWKNRSGVWKAASVSVSDQLKLTLKRAHAGVRYAKLNLWASFPALLFMGFIFWHEWEDVMAATAGQQHLFLGLGIMGILIIIGTLVWSLWYKAKKTREAKRLGALLKALEE